MIRQDFMKDWTFRKVITANIVDKQVSESVSLDLPHDAMICEERNSENPSGAAGAYYPGFNCIYSKHFYVPDEYAGKTVLVEFEGVMRSCMIFLNGNFVTSHKYGYTGFYADLTSWLEIGKENILEVKVYNGSQPADRWYSGTGIYRPVYLLIGDATHIMADGVRVTTPEVDDEVAIIKTEINIINRYQSRRAVCVRTQILNYDQTAVIAEKKSQLILLPYENAIQYQTICLEKPKMWSLEVPNRYVCKVSLCCGNQKLDTVEETFGIRQFCLDAVRGFRLNGQPVKLRGACIHHDLGILGAATFACAEERRIRILKDAGFNAVRISHYPASKALLEACDRVGMLVMEEIFDSWFVDKVSYPYTMDFADHWEADVMSMVDKDFNHPCVLMYSIGNEIPENCTDIGSTWNKRIANKIRQLDPTRYVTNGINPLIKQINDIDGDINDVMTEMQGKANDLGGLGQVRNGIRMSKDDLDLLGLNYARGAYEPEIMEDPNQIVFGSETYPPDIDLNWKVVKRYPAVIGDFTWTGWDYIGESGVGIEKYGDDGGFFAKWPAYLAYCGDINLIGDRRPMSYFREIVFGLRKTPYIAVQNPVHYGIKKHLTPWMTEESRSSWTWTGWEGKPCIVEVYSDAEEVELICNGKSLGRKASGERSRYRTLFEMNYEPGTLCAIAHYGKNTLPTEFTLKTADDVTQLDVEADRTVLAADGQDLSYIKISLKDENGILNDMDIKCVTVTVDGAGVLQGLGTGDPFSEESFTGPVHRTFEGRLLAVVRAIGIGLIHVRCECPGLEPREITLEAK